MSNNNPISGILDESMKNLKNLVDANSIIGDPISSPDGTVIYPISKVNFGYGSAGSGYPTKADKREAFGGGTGGGVTIQPIAFLVIQEGNVKLLHIATSSTTADKVVNMVPEVMDKIDGFINRNKAEKEKQENASKGI